MMGVLQSRPTKIQLGGVEYRTVKTFAITLCIMLLNCACSRQPDTEMVIDQRLHDVITEFRGITPGTTRADLERFCDTQSSTSTTGTFVHRRCKYAKVDVDFATTNPQQKPDEQRPTDKVIKVSKPYLENSHWD
jgi:hypothetical protein